jgi:hypothetical protein
LIPHLEQVIAHARDHYRREADRAGEEVAVELGYDHNDLHELFGWQAGEGR